MTLRWLPSAPASCFYAAAEVLSGRELADAALTAALTGPGAALEAALRAGHIPVEAFVAHLVPLAAQNRGTRDLAAVALTKVLGPESAAAHQAGRFAGLLHDLRLAFDVALSGVPDALVRAAEELRARWAYHGVGLLAAVGRWTEPGALVSEATVVVIHPARGGGGAAYPAYNLACLEAVPGDIVPGLPEILRLTWLLSLLNLDLPRYSEGPGDARLALAGRLAMLPITLAAAEEVGLARCDTATLRLVVREWAEGGERSDAWVDTVGEWWEVYRTQRPGLATALRALDHLLASRPSGPSISE
jgi:hypothetical protein